MLNHSITSKMIDLNPPPTLTVGDATPKGLILFQAEASQRKKSKEERIKQRGVRDKNQKQS